MIPKEITVEGLIDIGFERRVSGYMLVLSLDFTIMEYFVESSTLFVGYIESNAETMEDVKELIRLFK
jgi:hypothetical protein